MLKIIIAEDEPAMRVVLKKVISGISGLQVIGEAENGRQLIQMVEETKPDVIFVDIDMPEMNGLEAAKEIFDINPKIFIIFATGYDEYTHEAFQVYAFDYLIKPFKLDRIRQTMERIKELKTERENSGLLERTIPYSRKENLRLTIEVNDRYHIINTQDIILITREERKTVIYTKQGVFQTYEPLRRFEERLKDDNFFRCHKAYLINTDMVTEISPWGSKSYMVKLANINETALMTLEKAKEFRESFCLD